MRRLTPWRSAASRGWRPRLRTSQRMAWSRLRTRKRREAPLRRPPRRAVVQGVVVAVAVFVGGAFGRARFGGHSGPEADWKGEGVPDAPATLAGLAALPADALIVAESAQRLRVHGVDLSVEAVLEAAGEVFLVKGGRLSGFDLSVRLHYSCCSLRCHVPLPCAPAFPDRSGGRPFLLTLGTCWPDGRVRT